MLTHQPIPVDRCLYQESRSIGGTDLLQSRMELGEQVDVEEVGLEHWGKPKKEEPIPVDHSTEVEELAAM